MNSDCPYEDWKKKVESLLGRKIEEPMEIQYICSLHSVGVAPANAMAWIHKYRQEEGR